MVEIGSVAVIVAIGDYPGSLVQLQIILDIASTPLAVSRASCTSQRTEPFPWLSLIAPWIVEDGTGLPDHTMPSSGGTGSTIVGRLWPKSHNVSTSC